MPVLKPLNPKQVEYARFRAEGLEPKQAYGAAGYSLSIGCLPVRLEEMETHPKILKKVAFFKRVKAKHGDLSEASQVQVKAQQFREAARAPAAERERILDDDGALAPTTAKAQRKPMGKDDISQSLTELHAAAVGAGDLGTARQCLVDLGKDIGMFTPVQKIRFETVDDLNLEDTEALIKRLMMAKASEVPEPSEEEGTAPALVQ